MPKRSTKTSRSLDQARLAQERARPKRSTTPATPAKRAKTKTPPPEPDPEPPKPKRKRGRPPKPRPEVFQTPAEPEVSTGPRDDKGAPLSALWDSVRGFYAPEVVAQVDALIVAGRVSLDDMIWLEIAEHSRLQIWTRDVEGDRVRERALSMGLQSRKQISRLLELCGTIGSANDVPVRVPEGLRLELLPAPDGGDDVLGTPTDTELPERYR